MATSATELRALIPASKLKDEAAAVAGLLQHVPYTQSDGREISKVAAKIVQLARSDASTKPILDTFLTEYGLSNKEGVALMCLAESLLRIPDERTADELIADKMQLGDWVSHAGSAESALVNASTWALMLTGKLVAVDREFTENPGQWLRQLTNRVSEPVVRAAMRTAMKILGREFVLGATIDDALNNSEPLGLYSYDMLGEAAREASTAARYLDSYLNAIRVIGASDRQKSASRPSISIKLSALHPRYEFAQRSRVLDEMLPALKQLCQAAAENNLDLTIDAEEADRLDLSLKLFELLARDDDLSALSGLGVVVQAYGKRAQPILDWLIALATETGRVFPVRLVKGAYWDAEIKHAQVEGLAGYPVFTRKASTDLSYLVCARKILDHPGKLFGQFATHNAHTVAAVVEMAHTHRDFEFQRLHGMGESLYAAAKQHYDEFPSLRVYAPVGPHDDLLAYLVRRLLENGANSSFVNRFLDEKTTAEDLVRDPADIVRASTPIAHPGICLPAELYGTQRANSVGVDLTDAASVNALTSAVAESASTSFEAASLVFGKRNSRGGGSAESITNPADREDALGSSVAGCQLDIDDAFSLAAEAQAEWDASGGRQRATILQAFSDALESRRNHFVAILCREAGKTYADAVAEVREAVDFARYYAQQARRLFGDAEVLPGPTGESNAISLHGRGVFVCISPWNFPLAIFVGQVTAALAAGNTVVAKPAEETPIVAFEAVKLLFEAGLPANACQLILGGGSVGDSLVRHCNTAGVVFTGSTETAQKINLAMAQTSRAIAPLIAETGGQNAMIVDSSALLEQVTDDVIKSAFLSAGQRCSALRVLYLQEEIADAAIEMLSGAMDELRVGDPRYLATDVGPVISQAAADLLHAHIKSLTDANKLIHATALTPECERGTYVAPSLFEIGHIDELDAEHFGPVLHIIRFDGKRFEDVLSEVSNYGYGLTFGIHSRIESRVQLAAERVGVGNVYANRSITGAVVGTQPFGGQRLSGTGPKAGGPNYLLRFATERVVTINTVATGGNADLLTLDVDSK